jgi:hypothetical protein
MADIRKVKVTTEDIESVSKKLNEFAKNLPPGEQNVMAWLLARAAEAPPQTESFLNQGDESTQPTMEAAKEATGISKSTAKTASTTKLNPTQQLSRSLGVTQFGKMKAGSVAAGSSIGVTGTVMF